MLDAQPDPMTVTVEEAAALLGVSCSTGYELAAPGELPTIRLRRRIVVPVSRLAELLSLTPWELRHLVCANRSPRVATEASASR